jgi:hypothetical protein
MLWCCNAVMEPFCGGLMPRWHSGVVLRYRACALQWKPFDAHCMARFRGCRDESRGAPAPLFFDPHHFRFQATFITSEDGVVGKGPFQISSRLSQ